MYCRSLQMQYSTWCERNTQSWPAAPHCYTRVTKAWRASSWPEVWHHFNRPVNYLRSSIRGEKASLSLYVSSECGALYEIFSTLSPVKNQQTKMHINQKEFKEQSKTKMIYRQWRSWVFFFRTILKVMCAIFYFYFFPKFFIPDWYSVSTITHSWADSHERCKHCGSVVLSKHCY